MSSNANEGTGIGVGGILGIVVLVIVVGLGLDWIATGNNFFLYKFWAPKFEDVRRETYTHTQSYRQGNTQRLGTLCDQVGSADDDHKSLLNAQIKQEFADWSVSDVPEYLRPCLRTAQASR